MTDPRSRADSWWRTAPVMTIAVLALIISTAGGAYAVGKNSIGTKQLKKNAVTSSKIKNGAVASSDLQNNSVSGADVRDGSLSASDLAPGTVPAPPPASNRVYFAKIAANGVVEAKSAGIVSASLVSYGTYVINLGFDPAACAVVATASSTTFRVATTEPSGPANSVRIVTRDSPSGVLGSAFSMTIVC